MRRLLVLLLVLGAAGASAETVIKANDLAVDGFTITPVITVWDGDALATHQNMAVRFLHGDRVLWESDTLHEHDGVSPMLYTVHSDLVIEVTTDETVRKHVAWRDEIEPDQGSRATMLNTELALSDGILEIVKQDERGTRGLWMVRDADGPVLSGWVAGNAQSRWHVATLHGDSELRADLTLLGRAGMRTIWAEGSPAATMSELPTFNDLGLPACTDLILDPGEFFAGNMVRVVAGNRAQLTGQPREQAYHYELRHVVEPGVQHELVYSWMSGGPIGQTSFRPPFAGDYELYVLRPQLDCKQAFTVDEGNAERVQPTWDLTVENDTLHFTADVAGSGHYEYLIQHHSRNGSLESGRLVWAGKLHSHGGPVRFAAEATPGEHTVIFDVVGQAADPIVPSPKGGFMASVHVPWAAAEPSTDKDASAGWWMPFGVLAAAIIVRRR